MMPIQRTLPWLCLAVLVFASGCKSSKKGVVESPVALPTAFYDSFGDMWTCVTTDESHAVQGQVNFNKGVGMSRADILHISLLEIDDDNQVTLVATQCMNNVLQTPINFRITYNNELIDPQARYVLSTVFFTSIDEQTYLAAYKPDGYTEVINNGLVTGANILLKVP